MRRNNNFNDRDVVTVFLAADTDADNHDDLSPISNICRIEPYKQMIRASVRYRTYDQKSLRGRLACGPVQLATTQSVAGAMQPRACVRVFRLKLLKLIVTRPLPL